jgi:cystathionine beta-lyase/cystathionine gamma-synthase
MAPEARKALGITDRFVRLSVGLEAADDLVDDLGSALDAAQGNGERRPPAAGRR